MKRFITEYANYKKAKLSELEKLYPADYPGEFARKASAEIDAIVRQHGRGYITADECVKMIAEI